MVLQKVSVVQLYRLLEIFLPCRLLTLEQISERRMGMSSGRVDARVPGRPLPGGAMYACPEHGCSRVARSITRPTCPVHGVLMVKLDDDLRKVESDTD